MSGWTVIGMVVCLVVGFVAGALVMRRHYAKIKAAEDALRKAVV
jgi:F0F1-type ATP synthase assembly protein I